MEACNAPFAVLTPGVVTAAQASASVGVAFVRVPIADTWPAVRESPLPTLAAVAAKSEGTSSAGALPTGPLTQAAERALGAALAGLTACGAKAIVAGGTEVTAAPHHCRFAQALTAMRVALRAQRALGVALAGQGAVIEQRRQAEEERGAGLRGRRLAGHQTLLVAAVAFESGPALQGSSVAPAEHLQHEHTRQQHQRVDEQAGSRVGALGLGTSPRPRQLQVQLVGDSRLQADGSGKHHVPGVGLQGP